MKQLKLKIFNLLLFLCFVTSNLFAGQIPISVARSVARNLYYEKTNIDYYSIVFGKEYTIKNDSTIVYYIFNLQNSKGFIIISADDRVSPVIAYSTTNIYDPDNMPQGYIAFIQSYKNQITNVIKKNHRSSSEIDNQWGKYNLNEKEFSKYILDQPLGTSVGPLLGGILWNQGAGWNNSCPADASGPGGHAYSGCVSVSTSQIMRYHHHPGKGTGSHSYNSRLYGTLSANFAAATYDWANMPEATPNDNICQLLFHVGVSEDMDYSPSGSGTLDRLAAQALSMYFDYSPDISYIQRSSYTDANWTNIIKNEIDNARPVIYGGQDATYGGHSFVCDGYDATGMFHMNWGWSGNGNGYYNLNSLNVNVYQFNSGQEAVINIHPSSANVPVSNFKSDLTSIVQGNTIHFYDMSSGAPTSWNWYFPGGTPSSSTLQNPVVTYSSTGAFPVSLIATNAKGAGNNVIKNGYINVYSLPVSACTVNTTDTNNTFQIGIRNFQLGTINNTSGGSVADHGYKDFSSTNSTILKAGQTYPVSITVGSSNRENVKVYIDYNNNGLFTDAGELVYSASGFAGTAIGTITTSSTPVSNTLLRLRVISDIYTNTTLGPCSSPRYGQAEDYGVYFPAAESPVADFVTTKTTVNAGDIISLIDMSSNNPTSWQWTISPATYSFVNGTNANSQNPQLYFSAKGTYTITLVCTNANGSGTKTINNYITVNQSEPVADFIADKTIVNAGTSVNMKDLSTMVPTSWSWSISPSSVTYLNSTNANSQNPNIQFNSSGNYTVSLQVTNSIGTNSITKTEYIHVMVSPTCTPITKNINNNFNMGIQNVTLASINNSSGNTLTDSIIAKGRGYMDFSGVANTKLLPSTTYTGSVDVGTTNKEYVKVYIDYNNNGVFTDAGENIFSSTTSNNLHSFSFTTPSNPITNTYLRMRVISDPMAITGPCANVYYGQVEDYAVYFQAPCNPPVVTVNSPVICSGVSATLTAAGATTYSWSTGATNESINITPTATTTYGVTGTSGSCSNTATATVTVNQNPIAYAGPDVTICLGASTKLSATGGSSYSWSMVNGQWSMTGQSVTVSPTINSTYKVTVTDANSCTGTATVAVTVNPLPVITVNSPVICSGVAVTLIANGGTTYSWSTGSASGSITVSPTVTTTYKVTVTDANNCAGTAPAVVTVNSLPNIIVNNPVICSGVSTTLTVAGGTTYSWSTGVVSGSINVSPATTTTYGVTGTAGSCSNTAIATVTVNQNPIAYAGTDATITDGNSTTLTAAGGGSYSWSNGATTTSITVNPSITTTYTVTVTNNGCTASDFAVVTVNATCSANAGSNVTICNGTSTTLAATGGTSYSWSPAIGLSSTNISSPVANPQSTTTYIVTAITGICSATDAVVVTVNSNPAIIVNSPSICSGSSATLTATGGTTYSWSTGSTLASITVNPTVTTTYKVTGTTGTCTGTALATVTVNSNPVVTVNSPSICSGSSATLTATGGTTYSWSTGSTLNPQLLNPTITTTYKVTGTTGTCTGTALATLTVNSNPVVTVNSPSICSGSSATLTAAGGTTYSWSTGATTASITVSPTVTTKYKVTGTTGTCTGTALTTVTVNSNPVVTVNSPSICSGSSATLTGVGGTTYSWSTGSTLNPQLLNPTITTTYKVTGTTGTCTGTALATVTVNSLPKITVNSPSICSGSSVTLTATGGTTYSWSTGATLASITVSPTVTTTYKVTGTTGTCTGTALATVKVNSLPKITVNSPGICGSGSATLTAAGGTSYSWSTSQLINPVTVSPTATTTYKVTGTDVNGCKGTTQSTVTVAPSLTITVNSPAICNGSSAVLTATGAGTYSWTTSQTVNPITVSPTVTTTYKVTGTSGTCTGTALATVTVNSNPVVTVNSSSICSGSSATLTGVGGTTYSWSTGATTASITVSPTVTTTYKVTGTSGTCTGTALATVTVNSNPVVTVNSPSICSGSSATLTAAGGTTYSWSTGVTSASITVNPTVTTTYKVKGTTGTCTGTALATVKVNSLPKITVNSPGICGSGSATLTAAGGTSYSWSTSQLINPVTVSPTATTTYKVTGTDANGCKGTAQLTVTVAPSLTITVNSPAICNGSSVVLTATGAGTYSWTTSQTVNPITVSPTVTATYKVTGTSGTCTGTALATVTVNSNPVVTVNSPSICSGSSAILTGVGGTTYSWSTGATSASITVNPTVTTTYKVTGTSGTCTGTALATVTVNPIPVANAGSDRTICKGIRITLSGSGGGKYKWNTGETTAAINISPSVTTTYYLTVTSVNGCTSSDKAVVNVGLSPQINAGKDQSICYGQNATLGVTGEGIYRWSTGSRKASIIVSPTETTTYRVTVSQSFSCSASDNVVVVVNNSAAKVNAGSDKVICKGQTTTLTAMGNGRFSWSTGAVTSRITVSPLTMKIYTVTINSGGCTASDAVIVRIKNNPVANAGLDKNICNGSSTALTASGGKFYRWNTGDKSASITVEPTSTETYIVTVTAANGCSASDKVVVSVSNCKTNDIKELVSFDYITDIKIYPVPTNGVFSIEGINKNSSDLHIKVMNIIGENVYDGICKSSNKVFKTIVNISNSAPGIYMVIIENDNQRIAKQIIKN